jgi:hypothetical protein
VSVPLKTRQKTGKKHVDSPRKKARNRSNRQW